MRERDIYSLGIVLIGNFNPVIITPFWLSAKGLIRESEAETAKVHLVHQDITRFELDWLTLEVTQTRLDVKTNRESHFTVLRDLILSIFGLLKETPISAIGINHLNHFSMRNLEEYKNLGYWLSPVQEFGGILNDPKLFNIHFLETKNSENPEKGVIRFIIAPSDLITDNKSILVTCNHQFENPKNDAKAMMKIFTERWEYSFVKCNNLINLLWEKAKI